MEDRIKRLFAVYEIFERGIVVILLALLMIVVLWATLSMGVAIAVALYQRMALGALPEHTVISDVLAHMHMLHDVFGGFLLILIGVELMKTVITYLSNHELHVEVVFTVAMIAIARHAIDLNLDEIKGMEMLGMAALVITLAVAYFLFKKTLVLPQGAPPAPPAPRDGERKV